MRNLELAFLSGNRCRCSFLGIAVGRSSAMRNRCNHGLNNHGVLMRLVGLADRVLQRLHIQNLLRVQARRGVVGRCT